jgi:hypothetical protein
MSENTIRNEEVLKTAAKQGFFCKTARVPN